MQIETVGTGSLWVSGSLSPLEQACLASFPRSGVPLTLFSYDEIPNVPDGVVNADAAEIVPRSYTERFIFGGRANLSHFSDLFRYEMMSARGLVWVDADVIVIGPFPELTLPDILVAEEQGGVNGAVLFARNGQLLDFMKQRTYDAMDRPLRWGETGPLTLAAAVKAFPDSALYGHEVFYPVEHYDIWKALLPRYRDECAAQCASAATLHLFNNILVTMGYWKKMAPPTGSYLHATLARLDLLDHFADIYPEKVMEQLIENFRLGQNGKALGVRSVIRELVPSIGRTIRHYRK